MPASFSFLGEGTGFARLPAREMYLGPPCLHLRAYGMCARARAHLSPVSLPSYCLSSKKRCRIFAERHFGSQSSIDVHIGVDRGICSVVAMTRMKPQQVIEDDAKDDANNFSDQLKSIRK